MIAGKQDDLQGNERNRAAEAGDWVGNRADDLGDAARDVGKKLDDR
jgi:hypothetical protein